eukprot:TRINITY_DN7355_c0_g1_i1.p2 TRINITY_DN7355_c0_g1~~TRINITY_DN7355_c0_g1_i1.p2  ORF type:complete len:124 (+),score=10.00 TRINITY_DN7355_c0_g1_i1:20-391(+)
MKFFSKKGKKGDSSTTAAKPVVLLAGLGDTGKTTLIYQLATGELVTTIPTEGFNCETITLKKGKPVDVYDIGGSDPVRSQWDRVLSGIPSPTALLWVVDSHEAESLSSCTSHCSISLLLSFSC